MINKKEIKKLSQLARIKIGEKETKSLQKDLEKILDFVSKLKEVEIVASTSDVDAKNVMREDKETHKTEEYALKEYIKVKKVL